MEPAPTDDTAEADLVRRARRGDDAAFEALFSLHARAVHGFALRITGDHAARHRRAQQRRQLDARRCLVDARRIGDRCAPIVEQRRPVHADPRR